MSDSMLKKGLRKSAVRKGRLEGAEEGGGLSDGKLETEIADERNEIDSEGRLEGVWGGSMSDGKQQLILCE